MGWCGATEIMDAAVEAADRAVREAVAQVYQQAAVFEREAPEGTPATVLVNVDDVMRPFVRAIADKLRDGDWDCIEEADAFGRFRQEMLGYDDNEMADWYRAQLEEQGDPDVLREYAECLAKLMEAN
jgi:hypothetical protein